MFVCYTYICAHICKIFLLLHCIKIVRNFEEGPLHFISPFLAFLIIVIIMKNNSFIFFRKRRNEFYLYFLFLYVCTRGCLRKINITMFVKEIFPENITLNLLLFSYSFSFFVSVENVKFLAVCFSYMCMFSTRTYIIIVVII